MPRQRGQRQNFSFVKGWNTEASPMTFPEGTAQDVENLILDIDGSLRRRLGATINESLTPYGSNTVLAYKTQAIGYSLWENVAGEGGETFIVTQLGTTLYVKESDGDPVGTIDLTPYTVSGKVSEAERAVVRYVGGLGYLFVVGEYIEPIYVTYESGVLTATQINVKVRDFEGVDDSLPVDERPATLSSEHEYNLRNQGWPTSFQNIFNGGTKATSDPVVYTFDRKGYYPSNADILYYGKAGSGASEDDISRYDPNTMEKNVFGTSPAPKGKYVLDAFSLDRATAGGVAGIPVESTDKRPTAVAFHNGRVFYSGINTTDYTGKVYYSQQLTEISRVGNCYQDNDPTAEEFNQLLATDGGVVAIPDAGSILHLEEISAGIAVFATNGVWEVTGRDGRFSATEFYIRKVTNIGCIGAETIINADNTVIYWSNEGIVALASDKVTGNLQAEIITTSSIQTGYLLFGGAQRAGARGAWIGAEKKCVWLYSTDANYDNLSNRFKYNGVLIFDLSLGAFYKYNVADLNVGAAPYIAGIVESQAAILKPTGSELVTAGGAVVTAGGVDVTILVDQFTSAESSNWNLLIIDENGANYEATMGAFGSRTFYDWKYKDGVGANYSSFLETGHDTSGQPFFRKQPTYVYVYLNRLSKTARSGSYYN